MLDVLPRLGLATKERICTMPVSPFLKGDSVQHQALSCSLHKELFPKTFLPHTGGGGGADGVVSKLDVLRLYLPTAEENCALPVSIIRMVTRFNTKPCSFPDPN
jgi:hypothetical protein